jgi:hypothetical protein
MGKFFESTPKAVFAALAYSWASMLPTDCDGEAETDEEVIRRLTAEWQTLHDNRIVPQRPPKPALPTREERLAKLRADLREQFGMPEEPPQDADTRAAYIDASTAQIVAHTRRVVASATDESEDVQW